MPQERRSETSLYQPVKRYLEGLRFKVDHMCKVLPSPSPQDIEAALTGMRDGTSVYGRWVRSDNFEEGNAMWWVTVIDPNNVEQDCAGGGNTPAEAAAVGWINACLCAWWLDGPGLNDEAYAIVPRRVPPGWQFELQEAPGAVSTMIH